jgi:two-component system, chemotaxis family, protein-glutamate methylesterase/glutaminase
VSTENLNNIPESELIRVLVIDDSAFMRKSLTIMLESDPEIIVVGSARDGNEGLEKIRDLKPDIVTLDIEMPGMDGLTALKLIMEQTPVPVLMVSSLTTEGAKATMRAFDLGAVDFISKDLSYVSTNIVKIKNELIEKVKGIVRSRSIQTQFRMRRLVQSTRGKKSKPVPLPQTVPFKSDVLDFQAVMLAISTGGPQALCNIIPKLPENFPIGMAIVQHMPPQFTKTLSERLDNLSKVTVKEAEQGELMEPGKILIAPGGKQLTFTRNMRNISVEISDKPDDVLYRPSADIMMSSAASVYVKPLLGIIMTGMGSDGVEGLKEIKSNGGYVIAQDEETCIVYGMPQAALEVGVVDSVLSLNNIATALVQLSKTWNNDGKSISREQDK